jgi:hypothetical protein
MDPNEIVLESIDKLFEYEKHVRVIDNLTEDELRVFAKLYFKLYLKQQETVSQLMNL